MKFIHEFQWDALALLAASCYAIISLILVIVGRVQS